MRARSKFEHFTVSFFAWLDLMLGSAWELYDQYGLTLFLKKLIARSGFVHFRRNSIIIKQDISEILQNAMEASFLKLATYQGEGSIIPVSQK